MRVILTVALSALMLSGCIAEWKGPTVQRTALAGFPGVTCQQRISSNTGLPLGERICLNDEQWAAYRQPGMNGSDIPALYPNFSTPQVATGNPVQGFSGNP